MLRCQAELNALCIAPPITVSNYTHNHLPHSLAPSLAPASSYNCWQGYVNLASFLDTWNFSANLASVCWGMQSTAPLNDHAGYKLSQYEASKHVTEVILMTLVSMYSSLVLVSNALCTFLPR